MDNEKSETSAGGAYPSGLPYVPSLKKPVLPYAVHSLVFGIISLTTMACFGWILGIVAINNAAKARKIAEEEPGKYCDSSQNMVRAGHTMGMLGLIFGLLGILVWILYFAFIFFLIREANHTVYEPYNAYY